jgi:ParB family chromosome partitioning protein
VREDSCADAACFNRKLDAHIAQRVTKMPNLVTITQNYDVTGDTPILARRNYVEVVARRPMKGKDARPEQRLCDHLKPASYADGMQKGRLVKICANADCKVHFPNRQKEEEQRLQFKMEKKAANRKAKQTINLRHHILAEVLKRVKPPFGSEELRLVARYVLGSLSHDLVCRLAKRHGLQPSTKGHDWELVDKVRSLYKTANGSALAALIFEGMLLTLAGNITEQKDDLLADAARLFKVDVKALRTAIAKAEKVKTPKKNKGVSVKEKHKPKTSRK